MNNRKREFSKILAVFSCLIVALIFADFFIINMAIIDGKIESYDFTGFMYAIPSACTLCTATIIFYYNKAKLENAIKIKYEYIKKLLQLKKQMKLYTNDELQAQLDYAVNHGENSAENQMNTAEDNASQEIERGNL